MMPIGIREILEAESSVARVFVSLKVALPTRARKPGPEYRFPFFDGKT